MLTNGLDVNKRAFYRLKRELQNAAPCWDNPISCHPLSVTEVNIEDVIFIIRPAPHDLGSIPPIFANGKKVTDYILYECFHTCKAFQVKVLHLMWHMREQVSLQKSESESECECASGVAVDSSLEPVRTNTFCHRSIGFHKRSFHSYWRTHNSLLRYAH